MTSVTPLPAEQTTSDSDSESELDDSQQSPEFLRRLEQFKKKQHSKLFLFFEEPSSSRMAQHFANIMTVVKSLGDMPRSFMTKSPAKGTTTS